MYNTIKNIQLHPSERVANSYVGYKKVAQIEINAKLNRLLPFIQERFNVLHAFEKKYLPWQHYPSHFQKFYTKSSKKKFLSLKKPKKVLKNMVRG